MVHEGRQPETVNVWQDAAAYIKDLEKAYLRGNWQGDAYYVEVRAEKGTIVGAIRPLVCTPVHPG